MGLSFSDCKEQFLYSTIPLAPSIKMCLLTTDLTLRIFFYTVSEINVVLSQEGGLPRDASCREVQLPFSEFCSSLKYCFLINLTVDSFTSLINVLEKRLTALVYPYSQAHLAILALLPGVKWPKFPSLGFRYFLIVSKTWLLPTWTNCFFFSRISSKAGSGNNVDNSVEMHRPIMNPFWNRMFSQRHYKTNF